ncbi:hypothetical protein CPHO_11440 [Corynebacterium phocae]|uniref:DUF732 domain-containing protein n=1 Tax=Corynebacterium phocae TaxID=161895 RepID=A0A1L7D5I3_9CORY|nr:DUF732 domain-containing protein [Corynebacterium phocae]APT93398.1 hypothetical protein CPHO_11440 [Corynebacterium phocae]KAA8721740.1 DUF732 domain-containing protein [Corynebacterium phocae]
MRLVLCSALAGCAVLLTACGGAATVDNTAATAVTSIAPLDRSPQSSAPDTTTTTSETTVVTTKVKESEEPVADAPAPAGTSAEAEDAYLDDLKEAGINVEGVEDQLIGAAQAECNAQDQVTVPAVAGQLIEQARTQLEHGQVVEAIAASARTHYCQ